VSGPDLEITFSDCGSGITLEEMDALFMKPMHRAVWAQLRGRSLLPDRRPSSPSIYDEKLESQVAQVERKPT
jgi:hypothetical protein